LDIKIIQIIMFWMLKLMYMNWFCNDLIILNDVLIGWNKWNIWDDMLNIFVIFSITYIDSLLKENIVVSHSLNIKTLDN